MIFTLCGCLALDGAAPIDGEAPAAEVKKTTKRKASKEEEDDADDQEEVGKCTLNQLSLHHTHEHYSELIPCVQTPRGKRMTVRVRLAVVMTMTVTSSRTSTKKAGRSNSKASFPNPTLRRSLSF